MPALHDTIAVVVMSFNRPYYFSKCIESLENNYNKEKYDFIILQDGAVNKHSGNRLAGDNQIEDCIEIAEEAELPNKDIRVNEHNLGIALQRDKVFNIFDEEYELIFQIEDDIIMGEYALEVLTSMANQFDNHVCTAHRKKDYDNIDDPLSKLNKVVIGDRAHWWIASMWEHSYRKIEDRWKEYIDIVEGFEYGDRPRDEIFETFPESHLASSDAIAGVLVKQNDIKRVEPVVSRAMYIGEHGVHFDPSTYKSKEVGSEGPLSFEEDKDIEHWEIEN